MGNDTINKHNQQKQLKTLICGHCWRLQCNETTAISRIFMQFMHVHCCFAKPSAEAGHLIISKQTTFLDPIFIVCRHYYVHKFKLSLKMLRHWLILTLLPILNQSHKVWVMQMQKLHLEKQQQILEFLGRNFWPKTLFTTKTIFILFLHMCPLFKRNHWTFKENKGKNQRFFWKCAVLWLYPI